jgi:hypothetical protein
MCLNVSGCLIPAASATTAINARCVETAVLHEPSDFRQDASNITCTAQEYFSLRRNKQMTVEHDKINR